MTEEEFITIARRAEREVQSNHRLYKMKVAMLALLGYAVIFILLAILVGLLGGMVAAAFVSTAFVLLLVKKKLIIVVAVAAWVILKALWVRFEKPEGYELKREEFPELFSEIDQLREQLHSLPIHKVILTNEMNAAVVQTPRLGIFGWQYNTLILGLQLLLTLRPDEARSVLAHELGHLSGNHSRFSTWIYRVRASWNRIMHAFKDGEAFGVKAMRRFFNWYAPYFSAYSFALARSNEYEADALAARLTSREASLSALAKVHVTSPYADRVYWDQYFKKADALAEPDHLPYVGLARFLEERPQPLEEFRDRLDAQMQRDTSYEDTHPALRERIHALGGAPVAPLPTGRESAAVLWFGANYPRVIGDFDRLWFDTHGEKWRGRYDYVQGALRSLAELESKDPAQLQDIELWNKAMWTEEFRPERDPLPLMRQYKERVPDDPDADFVIGRLLAERHDPACLSHLDIAANKDALTVRACQVAYGYLNEQQQTEEAERWRERAVAWIEFDEKMKAERASVQITDELITPTLSEADWQAVAQALSEAKNLKSAWIAQKVLSHKPEQDPVYIIAFKAKGFYWSWEDVSKKVSKSLSLPISAFVIVQGGDYRKFAKKVMKNGKKIV